MWLMAAEHIRAMRGRQPASAPRGGPEPPRARDRARLVTSPVAPARRARRLAGRVAVTAQGPLFHRSARNPILTAADVPYPANSVFNPGAARVGDETILLVRVEDLRGISQLHVARSTDGESGWTFDPEPLLRADVDQRPRGDLGLRGPAPDLAARARGMGDRLHRLQPPRPARVPGHDARLPNRPPSRPGHAARGQGRGDVPAPLREPLGAHPPAVAAPRRRPHVAVLLAGHAPLGRPQAAARGPGRRVVGCRQDRPRPAAARDARGLAGHVPRRPGDLGRPDLPRRPRAA